MHDNASLSDYLLEARQWAVRKQLGPFVPFFVPLVVITLGGLLWLFFKLAFGLVLGRFW